MVHIVLFNTEYNRQFEIVISQKKWNSLVARYGTADAIAIAFIQSAAIQGRAGTKRATNYRGFIRYTFETGEYAAKVSSSKKATAKGKGEYIIGRRASRRTKKDLRRMKLRPASEATRKASRKRYKTVDELKDKYNKDYSLGVVRKRERNRW